MSNNKFLYWAFQSSQYKNPSERELSIFQNKYKKDFEKRELYEGEELLDKFRLNGWRNALFSEVTSIILAFERNGDLRVKYLQGSEKDLLQTFVNLLKSSFQDYQLVHFDAGIVLPYINVRLNKNGFINPPHKDLKYHGLKPWGLTGFDLKDFYKGAGDYSFSLEEMAYILNIDATGVIPHEDEFTYYNAGDEETLKTSAIKKVEVMSQVHRELLGLNPLSTILTKEEVEKVAEYVPKDWLKELYHANSLTPEIKGGLANKIFGNRKKPTKKELQDLYTIIRGVYVRTDFTNKDQDSKSVVEQKEKEIRELLGL